MKKSSNQEIKKWVLWGIIVCSIVGMGVAYYLAHIHYMVNSSDEVFASFCNVNEKVNCDAVAASAWSKLFGIPVAIWGFLFYVVIFFLSLERLFIRKIKNASLYLFWLSFFGIIYSVFLIYISKVVLDLWCLLCAALWLTNLVIFVLALKIKHATFLKGLTLIKNDILWFFKKWYRLTPALMAAVSCIVFLLYTTNLEMKKQASLIDHTPIFTDLITPVSLTGKSYGAKNPRLTIIEFSDFQCPHCKKLHHKLKKIATAPNSKIRVIHKDYPLDQVCHPLLDRPFHTSACKASLFVRCAGHQNKYWEAFELAFDNQRKLNDDTPYTDIENKLNLNHEQLKLCMESNSEMAKLKTQMQEAIDNGFMGTPVVIFDGKKQLLSSWSKGRLEKAINFWLSGHVL